MRTLEFRQNQKVLFEFLYEVLFSFSIQKIAPDRKFWKRHKRLVAKFDTVSEIKKPEVKRLDTSLRTLTEFEVTAVKLEEAEFELLNQLFDATDFLPVASNRVTDAIEYLEAIPEG